MSWTRLNAYAFCSLFIKFFIKAFIKPSILEHVMSTYVDLAVGSWCRVSENLKK